MLSRRRSILAVLTVTLVVPAATGSAQPVAAEQQQERIAAAFVIALGRTSTAVETEQWAKHGGLSVADLIARHREGLQADANARRAVVSKAGQDAFGTKPSDEATAKLSGVGTYTDLMKRHIAWLAEHPADYEQVMHRAYRLLLQRDAYSVEIDYWKRQPTLSFALLVGCIEDWARRNRPGLMATTGVASVSVNSPYLVTVRLSPAVAREARAAAG
ncbi:MAG: hypothetical protein EHM13_05030, partial [Acidobacteria bacterium]